MHHGASYRIAMQYARIRMDIRDIGDILHKLEYVSSSHFGLTIGYIYATLWA